MAKPTLILNPKFTALALSTVQPGAKLFIYQAGTTTKLTTYTDSTLGTSNPNPMMADSNGQFSDMYVKQSFKLVLSPSNDTDPPTNQYWTEDNLVGLGQTIQTVSKNSSPYTTLVTDRDKYFEIDCSSGNMTINLLASASAGNGFRMQFKKIDSTSNTMTIVPFSTENLDGANSNLVFGNQNDYVAVVNDGTQWFTETTHTLGATTFNAVVKITSGGLSVTGGNISVSAGTLISGAATGGQVGTLTLFPTTASKGQINISAIANTGNTTTTIQNAAQGQADTLTIPDPLQATANFVLAPNALVNNQFPIASGTTGLLQDSSTGIVTVTMNQAAVTGAFATPVQLIAAPGAGKAILLNKAPIVYTNFQTSAFTGGGIAIIQYNNTVHGAGTNACGATIPAAEVTAASSQLYMVALDTATAITGVSNQGIFFSNATGGFGGGNAASTITITLEYTIVTATV